MVFFYELHEGDDETFGDLILAREEEVSPDLFFETVQEIRRRVQETFGQDTLIEAIAEELERDHGFIYVSDDRLTAAVHVSTAENDNFLADLDDAYDDRTEDADEKEDADEEEDGPGKVDATDDADYRSLLAEFRGETPDPLD